MGRELFIAPSILSADFTRLAEAVALVEEAGADLIHVDVMDGRFVPNLTIGPPVVRALKRVARQPLDVHLMVDDPDRTAGWYVDAGARHRDRAHRGRGARASYTLRDQGRRRDGGDHPQSGHAGLGDR